MIKTIVLNEITRKPMRIFILFIIIVVNFLLIQFSFISEKSFMGIERNYSEKNQKIFMQIEFPDIFSRLYGKEGAEEQLKTMYQLQNSSKDFIHYEIYKQPVYLFNYQGPSIFRYGYENGATNAENDTQLNVDGKNVKASFIKSVQLSLNCFPDFNMSVIDGRTFTKEDYEYSPGKTIPVILGSEYRQNYHLGQKIEVEYIAKVLELEVVGFLKEDSNIQLSGNVLYLDRYIVMPSFNCNYIPKNIVEKVFQIRHYANKTSGFLCFKDGISPFYIIIVMNNMSNSSGLANYQFNSINSTIVGIFSVSTVQMVWAIKILRWTILMISLVILLSVLFKNLNLNKVSYAAYLIAGSTLFPIIVCYIIEIFLLVTLSTIASFLLGYLLFGNSQIFYLNIIILSSCILLLTSIYSIFIIKKMRILDYMGGTE